MMKLETTLVNNWSQDTPQEQIAISLALNSEELWGKLRSCKTNL